MMKRNILRTGAMAVCAAVMLMGKTQVSAAEIEPQASVEPAAETSAETPEAPETAAEQPAPAVDMALLTALTAPAPDHETALIQSAQAEVVLQGIVLDKYHNINVLGDSLTAGMGARTPDKAYPVILSRLTGANVNNYGLGCSRITDIVSDNSNPASFVDRMYAMDKTADLVVVFGGTNDFWYGDCPIGNRTDTRADTFYGALNTMIPYLKSAHAGADIVFVVPYQQSKDADEFQPYKRSTYGNFGTGTLNDYRIAMLDRCEYYGIPVLDLYMDYDLNTVDNREALEKYGNYLCDGCHLNDAGYNLLARKIYQFIMQDFSTYVPAYTEINDMVFETAALPSLISNGSFVMPNGQVIAAREEFPVDPAMPLQYLYQCLIASAMY